MFIAHLPAGYLMAQALRGRRQMMSLPSRSLLMAAMSGAIAPDMDLIYFFLIDGRQHNHHDYFSHYPLTWAVLFVMACLGWRCIHKRIFMLLMIFAGSSFLHLILDSVVGDIAWLAPWSMQKFSLFEVPARFQPWWLNFILHPVFLLELMIAATAGAVAWQSYRVRRLLGRGRKDKAR